MLHGQSPRRDGQSGPALGLAQQPAGSMTTGSYEVAAAQSASGLLPSITPHAEIGWKTSTAMVKNRTSMSVPSYIGRISRGFNSPE